MPMPESWCKRSADGGRSAGRVRNYENCGFRTRNTCRLPQKQTNKKNEGAEIAEKAFSAPSSFQNRICNRWLSIQDCIFIHFFL